MQFKTVYLPKQLLRRFLLWQLGLLVPLAILTVVAAKLYIDYKASLVIDPTAIRYPLFTPGFLLLSALTLSTYFGVTLWMAYQLVLPLGQMIEKAKVILSNSYRAVPGSADTNTEYEWESLAIMLNNLEKNLQQKDRYLKRDEEEFHTILGAVTEAIVATDMEGNLRFFNSQFALLFQRFSLRDRKYSIGEIIRDPSVFSAIREVQTSEKPLILDNLPLSLGDNADIRHFRLSLAPLRYSDTQKLRGVLAVFHDITDIRRAEQVRIDFVANVSHELRTPLTSIKGYSQTLHDDLAETNNPMAAKCLEAISRNTNRLIELVNDLLQISALESGAALQKSAIAIQDWSERIIHPLQNMAQARGLKIHLQVDTPTLHADASRIEQVLVNLLDNAIKYNSTGKNIFVHWYGNEASTFLSVRDDGPGIAKEHHIRLFERFYRVDAARDREQGGTGLGLAIVKHIMMRHKGQIHVKGDIGEGTEFICSFPN